jgi:hypothetical protein
LEVDVVNESYAITSLGNLISYTQVLKADGILFRLGSFAMGAHDEMYGVTGQVALIWVAVEALELVAAW